VPAEDLDADAVFEDFADLAAAIAALPQAVPTS
jgi:hypothetical protein